MSDQAELKLKSGHFNIFPLLAFVANNPAMSSGKGSSIKGLKEEIDVLTKDVLKNSGWYLWGRFNDIGWWESVYVGKAGHKKTSSLQARLRDELIEESVAFWALVYGREIATKQKSLIYKGKYDKQTTRSLRKMNAQFVIWIAAIDDISENQVVEQEALLIKMYRPTHNMSRPESKTELDTLDDKIEDEIKNQIMKIKGIKMVKK